MGSIRERAIVDADTKGAVDYMDYGIQLGRRFRALKAWMEHERYYSIAAPVTMAVVCFRFQPPGMSDESDDLLNERIVEAVNAGGDAYLTHTTLRGRRVMRVGVGNVLTAERHLEHAWQRSRDEGERLSRM